jgi:His Kinase A (phospho-acceptor) domain
MSLPSEPVTLSAEQVAELKRMLADLRHDINNNVALMLSAVEMMRRRPETFEKMLDSLGRQPHRITETVVQFSKALESALQSVKPEP